MAAEAKALFEQGVRAFRANDKTKARQLIKEALVLAPDNEQGWLLYARMLDDDDKRLKCVERALKINPSNPTALEMKRRLAKKGSVSSEPASKLNKIENARPVNTAQTQQRTNTADNAHLGELIVVAGIRRWGQLQRVIAVFLFGALGLATLALVVGSGLGIEDNTLILGLSAIFWGLSVFSIYQLVALFGRQIELYQGGLVLVEGNGNKRIVLWSDIDGIVCKDFITIGTMVGLPITKSVSYDLKLYQNNEKFFVLTTHYQSYREVGAVIVQKTQPVLLAKNLTTIKNGGEVKIGTLFISLIGIRQGNTSVRWSEITELAPDVFGFKAQRKDGKKITFKASAETDQNFFILPDIIATVMKPSR